MIYSPLVNRIMLMDRMISVFHTFFHESFFIDKYIFYFFLLKFTFKFVAESIKEK
jgi:hypothetical protein